MADIFLSYTEKDRDVARRVAEMLGSVGWTVWWDRRIPAGGTWRSVLQHALEDMRCMVVLWSAHSVESEWVCEEATEGRRQGKLVPVLIEPVRPPAGFREIQAADLSGWDGSSEFEGMRMLVVDLEQLLGKPDPAATNTISKPEEHGIGKPGALDDRGQAYYEADPKRIVTPPPRALLPWLSVWAVAGAILLVSGVAYIGLSWWTASQNEPSVATSVHKEPGLASSPAKPAQAKPVMPPVTTELTQDSTAPSISPSAAVPATANAAALAKPSAAKPAQTKHATNQGTKHVANPRCADLLARVQLGEALSDEAQSVFQKECRQ